MDITYIAAIPEGADVILVPGGLATPHGTGTIVGTDGLTETREATTGQRALCLRPTGDTVTVRLRFDAAAQAYPDAMFTPHRSRFTRFADDLVAEIEEAGGALTGLERARAIACHVAERFSYAHVDRPFNEGMDEVAA